MRTVSGTGATGTTIVNITDIAIRQTRNINARTKKVSIIVVIIAHITELYAARQEFTRTIPIHGMIIIVIATMAEILGMAWVIMPDRVMTMTTGGAGEQAAALCSLSLETVAAIVILGIVTVARAPPPPLSDSEVGAP